MKTLGLIVNPIAGMGGKVGLKGTDEQQLQRARTLGARPVSPGRALEALRAIKGAGDTVRLVTCPSEMGETEALQCGMKPITIDVKLGQETSAEDTKESARIMRALPVDLLLFAGGDGTARDVSDAVGMSVPVLGIPSGVKMHSGVFAIDAASAGHLAVEFLRGGAPLADAEVIDIDEAAFRGGRVAGRLYGQMKVPVKGNLVQPSKSGTTAPLEDETLSDIAEYVTEEMDDDYYYVLGPGSTVKAIADKAGAEKTLLGVDLVHMGRTVAKDLGEEGLLRLTNGRKFKVIVSPIGGQGFIFGRGNQQISPEVIKRAGRKNIIVVATPRKLTSLGSGRPLLVDTGDPKVDRMLKGYIRVVTGYREETGFKVE